jgi:hypothetical protein
VARGGGREAHQPRTRSILAVENGLPWPYDPAPAVAPLKRESYMVGPKVASWPNILTADPYSWPQVGPTFVPTL